jgi:hypothetical protein
MTWRPPDSGEHYGAAFELLVTFLTGRAMMNQGPYRTDLLNNIVEVTVNAAEVETLRHS